MSLFIHPNLSTNPIERNGPPIEISDPSMGAVDTSGLPDEGEASLAPTPAVLRVPERV
jgi:hypothetical protein